MRGVQSLVAEVASTDMPLLLVGEPGVAGVGKEAIATQVHKLSPRRGGLLRRVGCSALSLGDLDVLLQPAGSDRGAGTTVFLDEISELDYTCQARLLELLAATDGIPHGEDRQGWVATTAWHELELKVRVGRFSGGSVFHCVFELTNVARPGVTLQNAHRRSQFATTSTPSAAGGKQVGLHDSGD